MGVAGKSMAEGALRDWGADVVAINTATEGHALYFISLAILERHNLITACRIDMPTLTTHSIENTGREELLTLFWSHALFDPAAPDTFADRVLP